MERFKTILEKKYNGIDYLRDNRTYPLNGWQEFKIDHLFGKNTKIEVEMEGETITEGTKTKFKPKKIIFQNKAYTRSHNPPIVETKKEQIEPKKPNWQKEPKRHWEYKSNENRERSPATSPYNFVPINKNVVMSKAPNNDFTAFVGNSGYIDFEIENMNLMFIRGERSSFFKIDDKFCIPGSSLRGLIRTMLELLSFSKMNFFEKNKRLFMRFIAASKSDFKNDYYLKMGLTEDGDPDVKHSAKAGLLKYDFEQKAYFIHPSEYGTFTQDPAPAFRISKAGNSYEVFSGRMEGKKKHYIIEIPNPLPKGIKVNQKTIREYDDDSTRKVPINLLKEARNTLLYPNGVPVFYAQAGNEITSIGHTKNYRIPYDKTIKKFVHESHLSDVLDFAESIFGIIDEKNANRTRAGKVFFEDFYAKNKPAEHPEKTPKVLGSPKPTSFQLYLEQPKGVNTPVDELHHWDTDKATLRGNKLYWHRFLRNAPSAPDDFNSWAVDRNHRDFKPKASPNPIKALEKGAKFSGKIRFENLTNEELGALLFAINLPDGCCHKIGMAKPLGLGSIRMQNIKLQLKNIETRYQNLFNKENLFETGISEQSDKNVQRFKDVFTSYVLSKLKEEAPETPNDFWEIGRIKEFKKMLTFDEETQSTAEWIEKTKYQTLAEFKNRNVLPKPTEL